MKEMYFFLTPNPQYASECGSDLEIYWNSPLGDEILNLCAWIIIDDVIKIELFISPAQKILLGSLHTTTVDFGS